MSVLVTGASGFIGNRLLKSLLQIDDDIRVLTRKKSLSSNYKEYICDLVTDDIPSVAFNNVDTIFHLAAYTHDLTNILDREKKYRLMNVDATLRLAELAVKYGVKRFVFVSSVKAGGSSVPGKCLNESDPCIPEGIYGSTKRLAELKLLEIGEESGMHVSIVRPSLVYGPGVKGNLKLMISGIKKGWFPPIPDTGNRRSMVHVDDLARALILVANNVRANREIYIVTDGIEYSSKDIYSSICRAVNRTIPSWYLPLFVFRAFARFGDFVGKYIGFPYDSMRHQKLLGDECYSSEKIRSQLGFVSDRTFNDALHEIVDRLNEDDLS